MAGALRLPGGLEGDWVAHEAELFAGAAFGFAWVAAGVEVGCGSSYGAPVAVMFPIAVSMACSMATIAFIGPRREAPVLGAQVGAPASCRRHRRDAEGALEVGVAGSGLGRLDPPGGLVATRAGTGPGREMARGGEPGHVRAGLGGDHTGDQGADPGDGADQLPEPAKGFDHHLDPIRELFDRLRVAGDQVQMNAGEEGVVLTEPFGECLGQGRDSNGAGV